jgi:6-phosphofructokinase 1
MQGNVLIAQGGGPTAVINQSVAGVVSQARRFPQVRRIYGAIHGVRGIIEEEFYDLTTITTRNLEAMARTPSSGLCSTRDKPDEAYCAEIFKVLKAHDVKYFFYVGGNDSADTCHIISQEAKKSGDAIRVCHIPKTIDNDLMVTDHCPGYGSAAKFVAQAFAGVNLDNRAIPGVYIGVVMGRHAGFLTAAAALGRVYRDDGPHLIYVPEVSFSRTEFVGDVLDTVEKYGRCVVAVSEGIHDESGTPIAAKFTGGEMDAHGNLQLSGTGALGDLLASFLKQSTDIKRVRADTLGYLQRSFLGCVSEVDQLEAREVGEKAAQFCIDHDRDGSVAIRRIGNYAVDYTFADLKDVARVTKTMPREYMNPAGNDVTQAFVDYALPLIGALPEVMRIDGPRVEKKLR